MDHARALWQWRRCGQAGCDQVADGHAGGVRSGEVEPGQRRGPGEDLDLAKDLGGGAGVGETSPGQRALDRAQPRQPGQPPGPGGRLRAGSAGRSPVAENSTNVAAMTGVRPRPPAAARAPLPRGPRGAAAAPRTPQRRHPARRTAGRPRPGQAHVVAGEPDQALRGDPGRDRGEPGQQDVLRGGGQDLRGAPPLPGAVGRSRPLRPASCRCVTSTPRRGSNLR